MSKSGISRNSRGVRPGTVRAAITTPLGVRHERTTTVYPSSAPGQSTPRKRAVSTSVSPLSSRVKSIGLSGVPWIGARDRAPPQPVTRMSRVSAGRETNDSQVTPSHSWRTTPVRKSVPRDHPSPGRSGVNVSVAVPISGSIQRVPA